MRVARAYTNQHSGEIMNARVVSKVIVTLGLLFSLYTQAGDVHVSDPIVRLLPPSVTNTAAYLIVANHGEHDISLTGGRSDIADRVELHNHVMEDDLMKMIKQDQVVVPAGETVKFHPGGLHVMLMGLKGPLKNGQKVIITLLTEDGEEIPFTAKVGKPDSSSHHMHH